VRGGNTRGGESTGEGFKTVIIPCGVGKRGGGPPKQQRQNRGCGAGNHARRIKSWVPREGAELLSRAREGSATDGDGGREGGVSQVAAESWAGGGGNPSN